MVSTACPEAVAAGLEILRQGGKAADAAVATLVMLCVTKIGAVCIGGEAPAIVYDASRRKVSVISGQGSAPLDSGAIQSLLEHGFPQSGLKAATVPAIIALCVTLLREYGSMQFGHVIAPALRLLDRGRPRTYFDTSLRVELDAATGKPAKDIATTRAVRDWAADLATTLRTLATSEKSRSGNLAAVAECFYQDKVADQLAEWYLREGALLTKKDLETHMTRIEDPVTVNYHGYEVCKCGPWTQGPWLCQCLKILGGFPVSVLRRASTDYFHIIIESMKLAMADQAQYFGDPRFVDVPMKVLLSDRYALLRRGLIKSTIALPYNLPGDAFSFRPVVDSADDAQCQPEGTVACIVADAYGDVIVMTPSGVGSVAGSGGNTGITHGTRLTAANLKHDHPNCIARGKRPCITPSPSLILRNGRPWLSLSVPGGSFQDQAALQMILRFVDHKVDIHKIVDSSASMSTVLISKRDETPNILAHQSLGDDLFAELSRKGHQISSTTLDFKQLGGALVFREPETRMLHAFGPFSGAA